MKKLDLRKTHKDLYGLKKTPCMVTVPEFNTIRIDGQGDPNSSPVFSGAVEALFTVSYALKFFVKKELGTVDYRVMPLQGLWWADDMDCFNADQKDQWKWTLMIVQPGMITQALFDQAVETVKAKKSPQHIDRLRFEVFEEGPCAQILHVGPFSEEKPTIDKLHRFIEENGYKRSGLHHEIYLSDFRRTAPENLKTIIRQPVG